MRRAPDKAPVSANPIAGRTARRIDALLAALMTVLAFFLGWVEMFDTDVWWHVRAGEWILTHRQVPRLDPFTFSSANRPWIDLHWGFQVILARANAMGGVPGMVLLASTVCASAFVLALLARRRAWPLWIALACWVPALLLMSTRFDPRPESFSLLFTSVLLALLLRVEARPAWAWALPFVMLLWVNSHALFVIGLVIIGGYVLSALAFSLDLGQRRFGTIDTGRLPPWPHLAPASLLAGLVCLVNPYGLSGVLFPLKLLPKIADPSSPYRAVIDETMSLRMRLEREGIAQVSGRIYLVAEIFLLTVIPLSFLGPSVWRLWERNRGDRSTRGGLWVGMFLLAVGLILIDSLGLPGNAVPSWLSRLGRAVPALFAVGGLVVSAGLVRTSRGAGVLAAAGALACAAWLDWLRGYLFGQANGLIDWGAAVVSLRPMLAGVTIGVPTLVLLIGAGTPPFRLFLAAVFGYLGLTADRNSNLFGLVAGTVLAWNVSEWAAALPLRGARQRGGVIAPTVARTGLALLLGVWLGLVLTDRFFPLTGYLLHFGLRERPLTFAHNAARFAGGEGLPDRALVFNLGQTGVYVYHNAPRRKVFMDARLEVPSLATFETYQRADLWLNRGDLRGLALVSGLGDPLIMLDHNSNPGAEATLATSARWRCVYWDPIASVFIGRARTDLESRYPTVDFAARHFSFARGVAGGNDPAEDYAEARSLVELASALSRARPDRSDVRLGAALLSQALARRALSSRPGWSAAWTVLGHGVRLLSPATARRPPGPDAPWDPSTALPWALSTYCFQRTLAFSPGNRSALFSLRDSYRLRRMFEAQAGVESVLSEAHERPRTRRFDTSSAPVEPLPWPLAERRAAAAMHVGDPGVARLIWERSMGAPSFALQLARMGDASLASTDFDAAASSYRRALQRDAQLGVAWYGLALLRTLEGNAEEALSACRTGKTLRLTDPQRDGLQAIEEIASKPHARGATEKWRSGLVVRSRSADEF